MTVQEQIVAQILRQHFHMVDSFAYEGPPVDFDKTACDIIRELAAYVAFDILTGADKPTVQINLPHPGHCECGPILQVVRHEFGRGHICQRCGCPI